MAVRFFHIFVDYVSEIQGKRNRRSEKQKLDEYKTTENLEAAESKTSTNPVQENHSSKTQNSTKVTNQTTREHNMKEEKASQKPQVENEKVSQKPEADKESSEQRILPILAIIKAIYAVYQIGSTVYAIWQILSSDESTTPDLPEPWKNYFSPRYTKNKAAVVGNCNLRMAMILMFIVF